MAGKIKEKASARLSFPKDGKVKPKGYLNINPEEDITVILKGKVKGFHSAEDIWDTSKSFNIHLTTCEIIGPEKKVTLSDAVESAKTKV